MAFVCLSVELRDPLGERRIDLGAANTCYVLYLLTLANPPSPRVTSQQQLVAEKHDRYYNRANHR